MADTLPLNFPLPAENVAALYSYNDVADGSGIISYYGGGLNNSAGISYILDTNTFFCGITTGADTTYTELNYKSANTTSVAFTKVIDLDFDTKAFNTPRTLKGVFHAQIPFRIYTVDNVTTVTAYASCVLSSVSSGGAETAISTITSGESSYAGSQQGMTNRYFSFSGAVTETVLKIGEKLRVTVEIYLKSSNAAKICYVTIAFNPKNLEIPATAPESPISDGYSQMILNVPYKVVT